MGIGTAIIAGGMATLGAYSSYESAKANNERASRASANAKRRYAFEADVAEQQMQGEQEIAMSKMTEVTRQFLVAKGRASVLQAETQAGGNVQQRLKSVQRIKEQEVKGKIAKETDINTINIAQGMLAKKIDAEALIKEADASRVNVFTETLKGAIQGGSQGMQLAGGLNSLGTTNTNLSGIRTGSQSSYGKPDYVQLSNNWSRRNG